MSANVQTLRQIIDSGEFIVAPGVFEMISARVADEMGFKALYMTGYGATASYLGLPDAGLATYSEMVDCAGRIARGTSTPLIADADTGYGGLLNVHRTIQGYEAAVCKAYRSKTKSHQRNAATPWAGKLFPSRRWCKKYGSPVMRETARIL